MNIPSRYGVILSYLFLKGKCSFNIKLSFLIESFEIIAKITVMIITNELFQQIQDDISAVRGFL